MASARLRRSFGTGRRGLAEGSGVDGRILADAAAGGFRDAKCVFYATSSAADLTKPDLGGSEIRMRLGFMLDRGVTFAQAKRWLAGSSFDNCTARPMQVIYSA